MTFIPGTMPQSGSQWFAAPGIQEASLAPGLGQMRANDLFFSSAPTEPSIGGVASMPRGGGAAAGASTAMGPMDIANAAIGGLRTLGNLYMAFQANKLAKKQFRFQRDFANANLANSIKSYNTALEDRIRSRSFTEGRPDGYADTVINKNRLEDRRVG